MVYFRTTETVGVVMGFGLLFLMGITQAAEVTTAHEQHELVEALSGVAPIVVSGIPTVISQRFSDSPEIQTTAQYLKSKYDEEGIHADILQYDPKDAFPYYFKTIDKTYRSYFKHMLPMLQSDFDGLCNATLTQDQVEIVLKRLGRVALDHAKLCHVPSCDRVELYISAAVASSASATQKMIESRTLATWPNVVAYVATSDKVSDDNPIRPLCVIAAHMDSVAREGGARGPIISPGVLAPGADDNASGTAAVFTLAREMQHRIRAHRHGDRTPDCDLVFVHFSGEEEGLLGSIAFVHTQEHRPIKWMVNFDMIAFNGAPSAPVVNVGYDKDFGLSLPDSFHVPGIKTVSVERSEFIYSSDQIAFWDIGVPAISISEQACTESACPESFKYFNPNLHTPADIISTLDFDYDAAIVNQSYEALVRILFMGLP